jgi:hydroxyacylglutathione hydrolase
MKTEKIGEDVWKFSGIGCVYLIRGEKNILIDAGEPRDKEELRSAIEKVVPLREIDAVLLTHLHYDHIGGLLLFPNARIYADSEELENYVDNPEEFSFGVDLDAYEILKEKCEFLGEEIFGFKIIRVPGHTRGSVAILDEKRKLLFSGDTVFGRGIVGRTDLPNSLPEKMGESVEVLEKLVEEKELTLCPGHDY